MRMGEGEENTHPMKTARSVRKSSMDSLNWTILAMIRAMVRRVMVSVSTCGYCGELGMMAMKS